MAHIALRGAVAAAVITAAAACSAGPGHHAGSPSTHAGPSVAASQAPNGMQRITINATNAFRFDPATVTAHLGKLQVVLVDTGSYPHNLAVAGLHFTSSTVTGGLGQKTTTFTLTFTKPGRYPFVCAFHSSAGMRGEFLIR